MKITRKQAQQILNRSFPDYTGRKINVAIKDRITFYDTNWSGGTKNEYAIVLLSGQSEMFNAPAPWSNPVEGKTVDMQPGAVIVEHSYFCGQDCGITIYVHPDNAPKLLS